MSGDRKKESGVRGQFTIAKTSSQVDNFVSVRREFAEFVGIKYGPEMCRLVMHSKETKFTAPTPLKEKDDNARMTYGHEYQHYLKKSDEYKKNKAKVFVSLLGICDENIKNRMESLPTYNTMDEQYDVIGLLEAI